MADNERDPLDDPGQATPPEPSTPELVFPGLEADPTTLSREQAEAELIKIIVDLMMRGQAQGSDARTLTWAIPGVPVELRRQIKARAVLDGVTIAQKLAMLVESGFVSDRTDRAQRLIFRIMSEEPE